jgi:sulfur-carrier protein adenylyltransferase/sulfurtransferase
MPSVGLKDMIREARSTAREVPPEEAHRLAGEGALVLDVRESGEFRKGHIAGSKNVSRGLLELRAADDSPSADAELTTRRSEDVLVYCTKSPSARSLFAAQTLAALGYEKVSVIDGGLNAWAEAGLPTEEGA